MSATRADSDQQTGRQTHLFRAVLRRCRLAIVVIWIAAVAIGGTYYFGHAERFTAAGVAAWLRQYGPFMLVAYFVASVLRAFVLLPSTPFVLAGAILIPDAPFVVLLISMAGIAASASLPYFLADAIGFHDDLQKRNPERLQRITRVLNGRTGFLALIAWAFFPLAPTDAACCVAGTLRMTFWKFLLACLGELIICSVYLFIGRGLWASILS